MSVNDIWVGILIIVSEIEQNFWERWWNNEREIIVLENSLDFEMQL